MQNTTQTEVDGDSLADSKDEQPQKLAQGGSLASRCLTFISERSLFIQSSSPFTEVEPAPSLSGAKTA